MTRTDHTAAAADMAAAARRYFSTGDLDRAERAAASAIRHAELAEVTR
jgi:hypothetical protein